MAANNQSKKCRFQHGSIVRLYLRDFMQYSEVELKPGPTLNVIIGPNGSGKSSVVNGLALALGAKTAVLGRADDVQEFIRIGKDEAEVEVELNNNEGGKNFVINRKWSKNDLSKTKTIWTLNGKTTTGKQVTDLVRKLNIQTDNLCQFLPQDKVHDFSKMNPKQLLSRTIDAIGDSQLKEDHESLKAMQNNVIASEDHYRMKIAALNDNRKKMEDLEKDVKNLEEKETIQRKIKLLEVRREWNLCEEAKRNVKEADERRKAVETKIKDEEKKLIPIQKEIKRYEKEIEKLTASVSQDQESFRASMGPAKNKADRIEHVRDEMEKLDDRMNEILEEREANKIKIRDINSEIARLKKEIDNEDNNENTSEGSSSAEQMAANISTVKSDLKSFSNESVRLANAVSELKNETKALESRMATLNISKTKLLNIDSQKLKILKEKVPQGNDASQSAQWVENNMDKFQGQVYTPILLHINMNDANAAKYLENTINPRDLVALAAEEADDANLLLNELRNNKKLRANVVTVPGNADMRNFSPDSKLLEYFNENKKELDFKGFLSDMFSAPDPIKAYLCQQYQLHRVPIFGQKAETKTQTLVNLDVRVFFVGDIRNATTTSRYGNNQKSTISSRITSKDWMHISVDKAEVRRLDTDIKKLQNEHSVVHNNMRQNIENQKNVERELETKRKELKELQQRLQYKKVLKTKLIAKIDQKQNLEKSFNAVDTDKERSRIEKEKRNHLLQCVRLNADLKNLLGQGPELKIRSELSKLKMIPIDGEKEQRKRKYEKIDREIDASRIRLGEEKESVRYKIAEYKEALQKAQRITDPTGRYRGENASQELLRQFEEEKIQAIGTDECHIQIQQLEAQLDCIDDIDVEVIRRFKTYKQNVEDLEQEIERIQHDMEKRRENVDVVRTRWLTKLTKLIEEISEKFSYFFGNMGFAGMVELGKGEHVNDFSNYGIEILVKFRENVPLQKLDPFKQSGGERSVSTALYMLALQHLTRVPFRCVDEINQGMDAVNERRVFDMLMKTSVKDNSAQYFLLTPKLLPNLNYEAGVNVLIVHNSDTMCSYREWDFDNIIAAKEASNNRATRNLS